MSYVQAKIYELTQQIEVLKKAVLLYPDNMNLDKTEESIKAMTEERGQLEELKRAKLQLRITENVKLT